MAANATKTVEYALDFRAASLTTGVRYETPFYPIYIPEVTGRAFRSAFLEITCRDAQTATATRGNIVGRIIGLRATGKSFIDTTTVETITDSAEHYTMRFVQDVTSTVAAHFTGTSPIWAQAAFYVSGSVVANPFRVSNISTRLVMTYDYDADNAPIRLKTVKIPLSSNVGLLGSTYGNVGIGNQIPALDTFLPESNKTYRQIFVEGFGTEAATAVTTYALDMAIGAGLTQQGGIVVQGCTSSPWYHHIWPIASGALNTSLSHAFQARGSGLTGRFTNFGGILNVTYEYDSQVSTGCMNSLVIPWDSDDCWAETSGTATLINRNVLISEPSPITLQQSAVGLFFNEIADVAGLNLRVQPQKYKQYGHTAGTLTCGQFSIIHRFDSAHGGTGTVPLNRGYNNLNFNVYATDTTDRGSNIQGYFLLNYTSACATGSEYKYNQTLQQCLASTANRAVYTLLDTSGYTHITPSSYYLNSIGYLMNNHVTLNLGSINISAAATGTDISLEGWKTLYDSQYRTDNELTLTTNYFDASTAYQKYAYDPSSLFDIVNPRQMRLRYLVPTNHDMIRYVTVHSNTFNMTGSLIGYVGNPSGTQIRVYGTSGYRYLGSTTSDSSGFFSFPWYDNTEVLFCEAIDPSGYGRSTNSAIGV